MFVSNNSLKSCVKYAKDALKEVFDEKELKSIVCLLFEELFQLTKSDFILQKEKQFSESELLRLRETVLRLKTHEPIQYVLGKSWFCDLHLKSDKRALIPRPETEELVKFVMQSSDANMKLNILDICTGSGCIALAIKHQFKQANVCGTDVSFDAIDLANVNKKETNLNVSFYPIDLFSDEMHKFLYSKDKWHWMVANPPYIPHKDKSEMQPNVLQFEPNLALFVENENPLRFYNKIATLARDFLAVSGKLLVETHENLAMEVKDLFLSENLKKVSIIKDLQNKNRFVYAEN
jgi:release factor glutamine methyltransferase